VPARIVVSLVLVLATTRATAADVSYPRLGLYGHVNGRGEPVIKPDGTLDPVVLDQVARRHVVVLDASPFTEYRPDALAALRTRRPDLVLLAYVQGAYAYYAAQPDSGVHVPTRFYNTVRNANGFLYAKNGTQFRNANINLARRNAQGRFVVAEAVADFFVDQVHGPGDWDGLFLDRFCNGIGWDQTPTDSIDFVRAGYATFAAFDAAWLAGTDTLANRMRRRLGATPVLIGNCAQGSKYASFNGWMRENFPFQNGGSWWSNVFGDPGGYLLDQGRFRSPYAGWITSWPQSVALPYEAESRRRARVALATATLGDGFGTINPPDINPVTGYMGWWYDEYGVDPVTGRSSAAQAHTGWLGRALGPYTRMVWAQVGVEDACDQNPGFESSVTTGWTFVATNGATVIRDLTTAKQGVASARIHVPSSLGGAAAVKYRSNGDVFYITDTYSATFWAKASTPRVIEVVGVNSSGQPFHAAVVETLKTTWTRHQVQFMGTFGFARLELRVGGSASDVWFDDVHFQRGAPFVYRRDFDRGMVLLNTGTEPLVVQLEKTMRRIRGTLDPLVNDGIEDDVVTVFAGDAAFLLDPYSGLVDARDGAAGGREGAALAWAAAAPNPSAPGTGPVRLTLTVGTSAPATVALYDVSGRLVRRLHAGPLDGGVHAFAWDGRDEGGRAAPPGLYFARAQAGGRVAVARLVRRG
jgi:hypothetical protein